MLFLVTIDPMWFAVWPVAMDDDCRPNKKLGSSDPITMAWINLSLVVSYGLVITTTMYCDDDDFF